MENEKVSPEVAAQAQAWYQAEYDYWTKIISDEVARCRWNEGFEPLDCHLYELKNARGRTLKYVGITRICGRDFNCSLYPSYDAEGLPTLKLSIRVAPRSNKHH